MIAARYVRLIKFVLSLSVGVWLGCDCDSIFGQPAVELPLSDISAISYEFSDPVGTAQFSSQLNIFGTESSQSLVASEHSLAGINPDGVFSATISATVNRGTQDPAGVRIFRFGLREGDGVVNINDFSAASIDDPTETNLEYSYESSAETYVEMQAEVAGEVREAIRNLNWTHLGAGVFPANIQGTSFIDSVDPIKLTLDEYYENPFDAVPEFDGANGLAFRGQRGDFVSRGETRVLLPDEYTISARTYTTGNFAPAIEIRVDAIEGFDDWRVTLRGPDDTRVEVGDYTATRFPFEEPGVAGFDFGGGGRGNNELEAYFTVHDVEYDAAGEVERLDVSFGQLGISTRTPFGDPMAFGRLRFNSLPGDFNRDGVVDVADIDFYSGNMGQPASFDPQLDLNDDGMIDLADFVFHIENFAQTSNGQTGALVGDINLDGLVNVLGDAFVLVSNLNSSGPHSYALGDLNADQSVTVLGDAFALIGNLGQSNLPGATVGVSTAVPEPGSLMLLTLTAAILISCRRGRCRISSFVS
jgi:hypothetical protein